MQKKQKKNSTDTFPKRWISNLGKGFKEMGDESPEHLRTLTSLRPFLNFGLPTFRKGFEEMGDESLFRGSWHAKPSLSISKDIQKRADSKRSQLPLRLLKLYLFIAFSPHAKLRSCIRVPLNTFGWPEGPQHMPAAGPGCPGGSSC